MARRFEMTDEQWTRIEKLLPGRLESPGVTARDNRLFIDAVLWIARTVSPRRDLSERFGEWNNIFRRFISSARFKPASLLRGVAQW